MTDTHPVPELEFSQIDDLVFIGTNACCQMHFDAKLLALGVTVDISLEEKMIDQPHGVMTYLWLPTADHEPPSWENTAIGVATLELAARQERKTYIHCKNGHGRGPTLYAAYLISQGKTVDEAIAAIIEKRPTAHIEPSQQTFLETYATSLQKRD